MNKPPVDSSPGPAVTSKSTAKSAKERMREYRQRLRQDKEAYEAVKKKDRESKKAAYTPVAELSGRAHRAAKKRWKEGKRKRRAAKQETETQATQTPQTTEIQRTPKSSTQTFELSRQKVQSLLKKEQERKDFLLEIEILKNKVKSEEKKVEMYKKRCSRLSGEKSVDTPQKKMSKVLKEKKEHRRVRSKGVKRQLIYHFALLKQLKCLNKEKKKTLVSVCHGEILRKYKLTTVFRNDIGLYGKKNTAKKKTEHPFAQRIRDFFFRKDVSKIVAGKKNVVIKCKLVKQRRKDVKPELMRLHIVHELVIHHEYYLCEENLLKGYDHPSKPLELLKSFAMYSDFFIPGQNLSFESIKDLYKKEVKAICENKSFMGIWQMFALSSVLKMPIRSVYPDKGNPIVRKHLNRRIVPRVQVSECEALIMWTSTRHHVSSMSDLYWIPNHFVPVLQFSHC